MAYTHNFHDSQKYFKDCGWISEDVEPDHWNYCMEFWTYKYIKDVGLLVLDESAVIFNEIIAVLFKSFSKFMRAHSIITL